MVGTYLSLIAILGASALAGQGVFAACGRRDWSWLAPAVGLAVLCAVSWAGLSLTDEPGAGLAAVALAAALGLGAVLRARAPRGASPTQRERLRAVLVVGAPVVVAAVVLASLPFIVEGRFGILGTSLNPDMSQHLFAADRLASGGEERLAVEGYPLGPHALVVSVAELGPDLVEAFSGLTLAIAVAAALAPLALFGHLSAGRRITGALLVGFAYMAASFLIQGAFKETLEALFVLAIAIGLHELATGSLGGRGPAARWGLLAGVPLAVLAIGSVYAYSFPGLTWILGAAAVLAVGEIVAGRGRDGVRAAARPAAIAVGVLVVAIAPELGRMADFASFETFDPDGAGLGNLFNPISPLEALGIWPSGDFRLDPGAGFAPAAAFWLGGLVAVAALVFALRWWLARRELAIPATLAVAAALYLYALVGGTPYQEAKAIAIAAPVAMLVAIRPILEEPPTVPIRVLAVAFALPAAACSVLALANGPVGPSDWGPDLIELRESGELGPGGPDGDDTVVVAPSGFLVDEHGEDLVLWELRGGRVCAAVPDAEVPRGIEHIVRRVDDAEFLQDELGIGGSGVECPYIADGDRAEPGG